MQRIRPRLLVQVYPRVVAAYQEVEGATVRRGTLITTPMRWSTGPSWPCGAERRK